MRKDEFNLMRRSRWLLLALLTMIVGASPAWATNADFENSLPTGWETVGTMSYYERPKTGSYSIGNANNSGWETNRGNYIKTTKLKGEIKLWVRSYKSNTTGYVSLYKLSDDGNTVGDQLTYFSSSSTSFAEKTYTLTEATRLAIVINYAHLDNMTYSEVITGPALVVKDGTTVIATNYSYDFGLADNGGATHTFTLTNPGTVAVEGLSVSETGNFGATLSANTIAADGSVDLTVTLPSATSNSVITISSTTTGITDFVINVSGTVKEEGKFEEDFSGNALPDGWTKTDYSSNYKWSFTNSYASVGFNECTLTTPLLTFTEGEKFFFKAEKNYSYGTAPFITIKTSIDGNTFTDLQTISSSDLTYNEWNLYSVTIPSNNVKYIRFAAKYVDIDDVYGGTESSAPVVALSQTSCDFGLIDANVTSEAITITNTGNSALTGMTVTSNNANFTVAVADDATTIASNGGTATFTVTMIPNVKGAQTATITVKSENADDLVFTATGAVAKDGTTTAVFNDATYAGWTASGSNLSFDSDETAAYFYYGDENYLTSPKVNIAADDFLAINAKLAQSYGYVTVQGSADGTSWTNIKKIDSSILNTSDYTTAIVSGISTDYKYLRLNGYYCYVKQVAGLIYAPVLQVKKGDDVQTTGTAHAFGELSANQTVTYNFNNAGAGTINITNVESSNAVFTTNWTETVAASDYNLVITANYDAAKAGEQNGAITVTTTEGEFVINLTSTFLAANAPKFALLIGEAEQTTGADLGFGIITENTTKEFVIKNNGTGPLNVTAVTMPDEDYTTDLESAPSVGSPLVVAAGASKTIKVTLSATGKAVKSSKNITISAEGFEDFTFKADATVLKDCETVDFATAIPSTWENQDNGWSILEGAAKCTGKKNITSPKLTFTANDFFIFKVKASDSGYGDYVTVEGSADNGSTWTAFDKKTYSYSGDFGANTGDYSTIVVSGIPATCNKIRFNGYCVLIDEIAGLTYDANDPKISVFSNAEATASVTSGTAKDFGWSQTAQTATYYIKNTGTGTLTISNISEVEGFTVATAENAMTVAADADPLALTITMTNAAEGAKSGTITITTDGGNFEIPVSGFVYGDKNYIDFSATSQYAGWSMGSWTVTDGVATSTSSSTMQTKSFTVAANEKLYVDIKGHDGNATKTFSYSYSTDNGENWSSTNTLLSAYNYTKIADQILTISDIADAEAERTVLIRFTGQNLGIKHIYGFTAVLAPNLSTTATDINFSMQTAESAEQSFTITNDGTATLEGLSVTLGKTGENAEYSVALYDGENVFTGTELAIGKTITVKVKQLYDIDKLGAKGDVLTIAAAGQTPVAINLTGATRDASKMYVDFVDGVPATWTTTGTWTTTSGYAQAPYSGNATLTSPALTIAAGENLTVDLSKQYNSGGSLTFRYTTDGGITWNEQDLSSDLTYGEFTTKTLSLGNEGTVTAFIQFVGTYYARIDNIYGGTPTTAPLFALATSETLTDGKYDFGQALQAAPADKVFTITNNGNADLVSDIAANDDVTIALSGTGVTINGSQVTVPAGKSATLTVSLKFNAANPGAKSGSVTIDSNNPVADVVLNFTANVLDATASNVDFANNATPAGWYNSGFTTTSGYASNNNSTEQTIISELLAVSGPDDVLNYDAYISASWATSYATLEVSYSTDRQNWTPVASQPELTTTSQTFQVNGLKADNYYLKFTGKYVNIDNIIGWHKQDIVPVHDLYLASATLPTEAIVPGTEYTATVNVASLRADETVKAELYFGETKVGELSEDAVITNGETKAITVTGNAPATEANHDVYVKVYNDDVNVETEKVSVKVEHTRTLSITDFARNGEGNIDANASNQFSAAFNVTVRNTGSTAATPVVKIFIGENQVGTATADAEVAAGESKEIAVNVTNASAGEGGNLAFTAKAYWTAEGEALATSASNVAITVNAAAPKFNLAVKNGAAVADGDAVVFGLVKEATTKTYTITNSGNKDLVLVSIVAPEGYEATELTNENKTIAADGTLDIDVTLKAEQGKKSGNLVITYKVDEKTNNTFTLALTGRSVAADTWTETFDTEIPSAWTNNGWEWNSDRKAAYSTYTAGKTLMTPRLAAEKDEELTFDVIFPYSGEQLKVQYSTDKTTWNDVETYSSTASEQTFEGSFVAPAAGNYYLRFGDVNSRYAYIDNLVGFKLNVPEHDTEIAAESVPTTGTQYATYTATVTLKENVGKAEDITVKLFVNDAEVTENVTVDKTSIDANASTVVTLTWEPQAVISTAVKAYLKVTYAGGDLTTGEVDLTIAAPAELDEADGTVTNATYPSILVKHSFVEGWNTVCLPFEVAVSSIHANAVAFSFDGYNTDTKELTFSKVTTLEASKPYVIYVPVARSAEEAYVFTNVEITYSNSFADKVESNDVTFKGTYAPMTAGSLADCFGLTAAGKIVKANASTTMKGFRGYFTGVPVGASARFIGFIDDELTGIRMITVDQNVEGVFNLQGQKIQQMKKGGLYIINGKKQVVK